jgi:hypothetical protein
MTCHHAGKTASDNDEDQTVSSYEQFEGSLTPLLGLHGRTSVSDDTGRRYKVE